MFMHLVGACIHESLQKFSLKFWKDPFFCWGDNQLLLTMYWYYNLIIANGKFLFFGDTFYVILFDIICPVSISDQTQKSSAISTKNDRMRSPRVWTFWWVSTILPCIYMHIHTWMYLTIQDHTWPYMAIHGHTWPYMTIHDFIWP